MRYQITSKLMALFQREYPQADQRRRLPCTDFRPCLLANTLIDCGTGLRPADFCKVLRSCGCFVLRVSARAVNAGRKPTSFDSRFNSQLFAHSIYAFLRRRARQRAGAPHAFPRICDQKAAAARGPRPDAGCSGYSKDTRGGFQTRPYSIRGCSFLSQPIPQFGWERGASALRTLTQARSKPDPAPRSALRHADPCSPAGRDSS